MSFLHSFNGSRSPSSAMEFEVRTRVVRFGQLDAIVGAMLSILFRPSNNVRSRRRRGRFVSCRISLSVRSMASFWSCCLVPSSQV
jgi:hypothetical protein